MNYRHGFHAGNFADVLKHAVLVAVLRSMQSKAKPLTVVDSHAGSGWYPLDDDGESGRTAEWTSGWGRVRGAQPLPEVLADYADLASSRAGPGRAYPGSPGFVRQMLRDDDRLIACELHPDAFAALKNLVQGDPRIAVHHRNGYEALGALLPPTPRRGLILIDPPFEDANEAEQVIGGIAKAVSRWPTATALIWYPIKDRGAVNAMVDGILSVTDGALFDIWLGVDRIEARGKLAASGVLIHNPPFGIEDRAAALLDALGPLLARSSEAGWGFRWLREPT